jgi:hypothetical protein
MNIYFNFNIQMINKKSKKNNVSTKKYEGPKINPKILLDSTFEVSSISV